MPYNPMRKAEKHVTQEDMLKTLARHAPAAVSAENLQKAVPETPQTEVSRPAKVPELRHEIWLAGRLAAHGCEIFTGDTDPAIRRDRFRKAIRDNLLGLVVVGQKDGKPMDYATAFESLYGEPL